MDVFVANEQEVEVDELRLLNLARHTLAVEDVDEGAELSVLLVTSDHIQQLNSTYASEPHATDVLAFPMMEEEEDKVLLGDVVICPAVARQNAARLGHGLVQELDVLLVHGTLHLLGYDHQDDEQRSRMQERSRKILDGFSHARV